MSNSQNTPSDHELSPNCNCNSDNASSSLTDGQTKPSVPSNAVPPPNPIVRNSLLKTLSEMKEGVEADCFVQLVGKEKSLGRDHKLYFKLVFRDRKKSVLSFVWSGSQLFQNCDKNWTIGNFFKIRGQLVGSSYGAKLEIHRIREVSDSDKNEGFNPRNCQPCSELPPEELAAMILSFANKQIGKGTLLNLIRRVFKEYRLELYVAAASRAHHRTYSGGLLEHTLSVTYLAVRIYDHFCLEFPWFPFKVSKPLVVAGAILHDVGKILDATMTLTDSQKTLAGNLIGHQILGLEIIQRFASDVHLDNDVKYQLEHIVLTHSRFPDWGSPTPPQSLEAMILHYADYADSTLVSALKILEDDSSPSDFTYKRGPFGVPLMKPRVLENLTKELSQSPKTDISQQ